ncbi:unnamed protein product [Diatraea saccharalis]|uniref:Uncharacterized protein n=1 Tax=Diatraea saccharalis TaxID=40085 RepID=A0A9N9RFV8_9NEOP|nr:unnamed protein product [Diatraea saccharalis]
MHKKNQEVGFILLFLLINSVLSSSNVDKCIDYYKSDEDFDITTLQGVRYTVYFWPPNQRQRDRCEVTNFKILSDEETNSANNECSELNLGNETVLQSSYVNSANKSVKLLFYGTGAVKNLYRNCGRIWKYIFRRINDDYVMGINCSSGGRGVLLSKVLPTTSEVNAVVSGIEIMSGREGSLDCNLSPR